MGNDDINYQRDRNLTFDQIRQDMAQQQAQQAKEKQLIQMALSMKSPGGSQIVPTEAQQIEDANPADDIIPDVAQQPLSDIEKAIPNYKNADEFANNVIKDLQSQTSPLSSVKSFSNQDILDQLNQLGKGKLFNAREALKGSNPTEAQIIEANNKYHESRIQLLKDLYNKTKDYSSPQQPEKK